MIFVTVSTGHFDPLIAKCNALRHKYDFVAQIGSSLVKPEFPHFLTCAPAELERNMQEAELVIAHGGTGMLSMLYRLKKKAIVIPKQVRYGEPNDSQVELARKWGELKMAYFLLDVESLESAIENARAFTPCFLAFPKLGDRIRHEFMGGTSGRDLPRTAAL